MTPVLPAGTVCSAGDMHDALGQGLLDIGFTWAAYYAGKVPVTNVEAGLSFTRTTSEEAHECIYNRGLIDLYRKEHAKHGVYALAVMPSARICLQTVDKPVRTLEDLKGMSLEEIYQRRY